MWLNLIKLLGKAARIDPTDVMNQSNMDDVLSLIKEVLL